MKGPLPAGLLLAAGRGTRFDASGRQDKLMAPLGDSQVAVIAARALAPFVGMRIAVVRPGNPTLAAALGAEGYDVIECADAHLGMGHSLACGAARLQAAIAGMSGATRASTDARAPSALLVALADMPFIQPSTYRALAGLAGRDDIIAAPRRQGERGHPVLFGVAHLAALAALRGDRGANALLAAHPVTWVDVDDPGILADIDRPADLDRHRE